MLELVAAAREIRAFVRKLQEVLNPIAPVGVDEVRPPIIGR